VTTLLAAIAEFERDLIRERTGDGRKREMMTKIPETEYQKVRKMWRSGSSVLDIAQFYGVRGEAARHVLRNKLGIDCTRMKHHSKLVLEGEKR